jgi:PTH2 family peptidyl-tRNA hydrolase
MFDSLRKTIQKYTFENITGQFEYKQVIIIRTDLEMSCGKKCVQVSHASIGAFCNASLVIQKAWLLEGQRKIVLKVNNEHKLFDLDGLAQNLGLPTFLVQDAGRTEIEPGTLTALGIGPAKTPDIDKITGKLSLFKE